MTVKRERKRKRKEDDAASRNLLASKLRDKMPIYIYAFVAAALLFLLIVSRNI